MKFLPQNFNDLLALVLIFLIVALWIIQATAKMSFPEAVNGGLLVTFTLIVQFYFRRKAGGD